jgi:hypothetical protein
MSLVRSYKWGLTLNFSSNINFHAFSVIPCYIHAFSTEQQNFKTATKFYGLHMAVKYGLLL